MNNQQTKFEHWCIVELFGHTKVAGLCTEENIAGNNMLRVDVPETKSQPAFTKYFGGSAVYAINPVDETTARVAAESISMAPVKVWEAEQFNTKYQAVKAERSLPSTANLDPSDDDDDDDENDNSLGF